MKVRPARIGDIPGMRDVAERSWRETYRGILGPEEIEELLDSWYSETALRSSVRAEDSTLLVAERAGECAAYGEWGDGGRGPEIFRLYVAPDRWREGIGSRLLDALEKDMRHRGVETVRLYVHRENDVGRSFWEAQGYERHRDGDREDDPCELCMRKELA